MPRKRVKKSPYAGTPMTVDESRAQIDRLLQDHGADGVVWTTAWKQGRVGLRFIMSSKQSGRSVAFEVEPPTFKLKRKTYDPVKGKNVETEEPNWPQAMRMLYYWLKAKLEAVTYGLREVEREFLNEMIVADDQGRETTVGAAVAAQLDSGRLHRVALNPGVVDAEVVR